MNKSLHTLQILFLALLVGTHLEAEKGNRKVAKSVTPAEVPSLNKLNGDKQEASQVSLEELEDKVARMIPDELRKFLKELQDIQNDNSLSIEDRNKEIELLHGKQDQLVLFSYAMLGNAAQQEAQKALMNTSEIFPISKDVLQQDSSVHRQVLKRNATIRQLSIDACDNRASAKDKELCVKQASDRFKAYENEINNFFSIEHYEKRATHPEHHKSIDARMDVLYNSLLSTSVADGLMEYVEFQKDKKRDQQARNIILKSVKEGVLVLTGVESDAIISSVEKAKQAYEKNSTTKRSVSDVLTQCMSSLKSKNDLIEDFNKAEVVLVTRDELSTLQSFLTNTFWRCAFRDLGADNQRYSKKK